jgi:hypothetical protein
MGLKAFLKRKARRCTCISELFNPPVSNQAAYASLNASAVFLLRLLCTRRNDRTEITDVLSCAVLAAVEQLTSSKGAFMFYACRTETTQCSAILYIDVENETSAQCACQSVFLEIYGCEARHFRKFISQLHIQCSCASRDEGTGHRGAAGVLALLASGLICLSALPFPSEARITISEAGDVLVGAPRVIDGDTLVVSQSFSNIFASIFSDQICSMPIAVGCKRENPAFRAGCSGDQTDLSRQQRPSLRLR